MALVGESVSGTMEVAQKTVVPMKRRGFLAVTMAGALVLAGCGNGNGNGGTDYSPPASTQPPAASSPPGDGTDNGVAAPGPSTPAHPGGGGQGGRGIESEWTSGPLTVTHNPNVPPVPQLLRIRSAAHTDDGYDRIVFDFPGALPGYTVRYVDEVQEDPSGLPVDMPGRRFLLIVFTPAQAHTDEGAAQVSPRRKTLDYPMMRGYVLVGDFEGYVSVAIGLDDVVGYRVGELTGQPGRIYLDVAA